MKKLLLGLLISGTVIFLLLPAVFDEEEQKEKPKTAFESAVAFNPDDGEEGFLPVFEGRKKDNIFKTYSKRFKRMYGRALFNSPVQAEQQAPYARGNYNTPQDDDDSLSLAMAFLLSDDEAKIRQVRSAAKTDTPQVNAVTYDRYDDSYLPVKQTMHDNAPVKGLYESSSVEPPESRVQARKVYSNVMSKFEKPALRQKTASEPQNRYYESSLSSGGWTVGSTVRRPASVSSVSGGGGIINSFGRTYSNNTVSGNEGGRYSYYSYGKVKRVPSGLLPDFEAAIAAAGQKVQAAANKIAEESAKQEEAQQEQQDVSDSPKDQIQPAEDTVFDPEKYDTNIPFCSALDEETPKEETDKIDTCGSTTIGSSALNDNIKQADILIDVGSSKDGLWRITPTEDSIAGVGLSYIGIDSFISGTEKIYEDIKTFTGISTQDFNTIAKNPKSILITTSPAMAEKYVGKAVLIEQGSLETKSGLKTLADKLNNMEEETARIQSEIDSRNAAAAAAKKDAEDKKIQSLMQDITQGIRNILSSEDLQ